MITNKFKNYFITTINTTFPGIKISKKHGNVKTPLLETKAYINRLKKFGCETLDVEAAYFQKGCEQSLARDAKVRILLYIVDSPFSEKTHSERDFEDEDIINMRKHLTLLIEKYLDLKCHND